MEELADQACVVLVDRRGQPPVGGHDRGQVAAQRVGGEQAGRVDGSGLDDDQANAPSRPGAVIGDQVVGGEMVVYQRRLVRRRDDPVSDRHGPERKRGEQSVEHDGDDTVPP